MGIKESGGKIFTTGDLVSQLKKSFDDGNINAGQAQVSLYNLERSAKSEGDEAALKAIVDFRSELIK